VKNACDYACGQAPGDVPGHLKDAIGALNKPIVRWRELLRQYLGRHIGNSRQTYSRRNRRRDDFGIPGKSHRAAATATVIVDTSGSISKDDLQQFFAEIESIAYKTKVKVLQWDHAFQGYDSYRRGAWKTFAIKGRGGTDMAAPVRWLKENRLVNDVQIMLTDGYCNYLDAGEVDFPFITVITQKGTATPGYGHVIHF
jgi:predicted metal-dependent peptidase